MSGGGLAEHWDEAYAQGEATRSWFATEPVLSLRMLDAAGVSPDARVVDVGGGTSRLVDSLLARGHHDVTVVDVSDVALGIAKRRLGCDAARVHWILADARTWSPGRTFAVWHDRAVMHFLTSAADLQRYLHTLNTATGPGAVAVFGCFAPEGPTHCSGLPVMRRDAEDLAEVLGPQWSLVTADRELHATPGGAEQPFTWAAFVRSGAAVGVQGGA